MFKYYAIALLAAYANAAETCAEDIAAGCTADQARDAEAQLLTAEQCTADAQAATCTALADAIAAQGEDSELTAEDIQSTQDTVDLMRAVAAAEELTLGAWIDAWTTTPAADGEGEGDAGEGEGDGEADAGEGEEGEEGDAGLRLVSSAAVLVLGAAMLQ